VPLRSCRSLPPRDLPTAFPLGAAVAGFDDGLQRKVVDLSSAISCNDSSSPFTSCTVDLNTASSDSTVLSRSAGFQRTRPGGGKHSHSFTQALFQGSLHTAPSSVATRRSMYQPNVDGRRSHVALQCPHLTLQLTGLPQPQKMLTSETSPINAPERRDRYTARRRCLGGVWTMLFG
jgi:hypothetical protein